jgi:hypothetical protein
MPGLLSHARVEPAPGLLQGKSPRVARRSVRQPSLLRPIHARRAVDFQKQLQTPQNPADFLHRMAAASIFSGSADEAEQAAATTESAAPGKIIFVKVVAAIDEGPASTDKVGAILHGGRDRQLALRRSQSRLPARAPAWRRLLRRRRERHRKSRAREMRRCQDDRPVVAQRAANRSIHDWAANSIR